MSKAFESERLDVSRYTWKTLPGEVAVYYDWCSLYHETPSRPRTSEEEARPLSPLAVALAGRAQASRYGRELDACAFT